jgi:hypothetical protein
VHAGQRRCLSHIRWDLCFLPLVARQVKLRGGGGLEIKQRKQVKARGAEQWKKTRLGGVDGDGEAAAEEWWRSCEEAGAGTEVAGGEKLCWVTVHKRRVQECLSSLPAPSEEGGRIELGAQLVVEQTDM